MESVAQRMMTLFSGMEEAHGEYKLSNKVRADGKQEGKALTVREAVTLEHWEDHVNGLANLGVIPIRADNTCIWGAIDIDKYDLDLEALAKMLAKRKLPLFPFRSKSGGCHIVAFMSEPVPAYDLRTKLSEIAASIGHGKAEIFPKQSKVLIDKGDLGNWLNMPYFHGDNGTRYCLDEKGEALLIEEFLAKAEKGRLTWDQLADIKVTKTKPEFANAPPCLEALAAQGFPAGTRNNGLFALGVYARKAFPDDWEQRLEELNQKYMDPPLESKEVQVITRQLQKKDYKYRCNDQPIIGFCNSSVCRTRKFGVGDDAMPDMTALRKLPTDQPVWFLEVNGVTLEMTTEQLQKQHMFQAKCIDALNTYPPTLSRPRWESLINGLLKDVEELERPKEASIADQFRDHLETFICDAHIKGQNKEDLLLGRPWTGPDPEDNSRVRTFFRLKDLEEFLIRRNFRFFNRTQIIAKLQSDEIGARTHFFNIKGKGTNVWHVNEALEMDEPFEVPDMGGENL